MPIYRVNNKGRHNIVNEGSHHIVNKNSVFKCATDMSCPINIDTFPNQRDFCVNKISVSTFNDKINILNPNISTNKLSRYIFPRVDPPDNPNWFKDDRKPTEKMLDIICNSLSLFNQDEYVYYNQLCQRDVKFLEKNKQGLYSTDYCIKAQIRDYKAKLNKENYVENLGEKLYREPKDKIRSNFCIIEEQMYFNPISKFIL